MRLTNFWWLLIWAFIGGYVLDYYLPKETMVVMGKKEQRWRIGPAIALVIPYIIWTGFRGNAYGDTVAYRNAFLMGPSSLQELLPYLEGLSKDIGFSIFSALVKIVFGNRDILYFLILAIIQMICLVILFRKYSCDYWQSVFLFVVSTEYIGWMHNGVRQFTAAALIYVATELLLKKRYIAMIVVILLASTIHGSAMLMIPIIFIIQGKAWNKKTLLCILSCIAVLFLVDQFTNVLEQLLTDTQYTNVVSDWKSWNDDGTNPLRVLVFSIPMLLSIVGLRIIKQEDDPVINMATNASIVTTGIYLISMVTSGIFIGRLPIYTSLYSMCILLPWEIKNLFTIDTSRLVKLITISCYVVFFYYQMHFAWGLL